MARMSSSFCWALAVCFCLQAMSSGVLAEGDATKFTYDNGPSGPAHWGDLNVNWTTCKTGQQQSPIRITPNLMFIDPSLGELDASYSADPVPANISINKGHGIEVTLLEENVGQLKIDGVTYLPTQFHFHMGSEHRILGHRFVMELHQVFASADGAHVAVVAWLFVKGAENPFLAQFETQLPSQRSAPEEFMLNPIHMPKFQKSYARYQGSLTTPPCTEGVTWTVMLWNFPTISERQIKLFKKSMPIPNARPSQPSHGRQFLMNAYGSS